MTQVLRFFGAAVCGKMLGVQPIRATMETSGGESIPVELVPAGAGFQIRTLAAFTPTGGETFTLNLKPEAVDGRVDGGSAHIGDGDSAI